MSTLFRLSAFVLTLALSACAGRHAYDTNSHDNAPTRSGVQVYGDVDVGVGSQRIR